MMQRLLLLVSLLVLGACQSLPSGLSIGGEGSPDLWQQHQKQARQLDAWDISGKLAVRSEARSGSAVLYWLQRKDYFDIIVSGPLGQGSTRLTGRSDQPVKLTTPDVELSADTAEDLMDSQLGWSLPVENLYWWVRGLPVPDRPYSLQLNSDSLARHLQQDNWQLDYVRYQHNENGIALPERIQLSGPHLQLTLLVKQWQARTLGGQP